MQRYLLIASLCLLAGMGIASPATQVPNKLFDVRNGNGLVLDGTTYTRATVIVFKDNASKNAIMEAVAANRGWTATVPDPKNPGQTIPNPLSEQAEFQRAITQYLRDNYRTFKISTAEKAAKATAEAAADADLPPQGN